MALTQVDQGLLGTYAQYTGFKNRLINGAGQIWQRGTTISNIPATGTSATYGPDRWCFGVGNTGFTAVAQAVQVSNGGIRVNCTTSAAYAAAGDVFALRQIIEGLNCYDLAGQQVTVSFQVKTNKTGNYGVMLYDYTGSSFGTPQSITVSSSGVTTSYALTFTAPASITADNAARLGLNITLAANTSRAGSYYPSAGSQVNLLDSTSNYFEIYNIQLEKGSTATSFDYRPYGTELALCQRYYYRVTPSAGWAIGNGYATSTTTSLGVTIFPTTMRTNPTALEQSGTASDYSVLDGTGSAIVCSSVPTFSQGYPWGARSFFTLASGLVGGQGNMLRAATANGYLGWSAEL